MGLYPFTREALEQMLGRVNLGNFNPRILIKDVLKYTLETSYDDIKKGRFPSVSLREHFGRRLNAMLQADIKAKDPQNYDRREVLLDLWNDSNEICNLHPAIHTAFDISLLEKVTGQQTQIYKIVSPLEPRGKASSATYNLDTESTSDKTDRLTEELPEKLAEKIKNLDNWNNQEILPQDIAKDLREFIYPAVIDRIEWDTEMLLKGTFTGSGGKLFQQRNVIFHSPKVTRETIAGIKLSLPLNPNDPDEFRETAIAFQGILQYSHYKHWKFPNGDRYFRTYAKQLERWSQHILEEIRRRPRESGEPWNPVPAAVELLVIAARMAGHSTNSLEDLVNALFLGLDRNDEETRASAWRKLFDSLKKYRDPLLDIVKSRIACTKGISKDFQIIDAIQLIVPLKKVSKDWQPKCDIPDDLRKEFEVIQKARQQLDELLKQAIQEERDRLLGVYQALVSELGEELNQKEAIEVIKQAMDRAREASVFGQMNADNLTTVLDKFKRTPIAGYIATMKRVQTEADTGKLFQELSGNHQRAMTVASEFLSTTKNFFDTSLNRAQGDIENLLSAEGGTVESSHQAIQAGLAQLRSLVTEIKGEAT